MRDYSFLEVFYLQRDSSCTCSSSNTWWSNRWHRWQVAQDSEYYLGDLHHCLIHCLPLPNIQRHLRQERNRAQVRFLEVGEKGHFHKNLLSFQPLLHTLQGAFHSESPRLPPDIPQLPHLYLALHTVKHGDTWWGPQRGEGHSLLDCLNPPSLPLQRTSIQTNLHLLPLDLQGNTKLFEH